MTCRYTKSWGTWNQSPMDTWSRCIRGSCCTIHLSKDVHLVVEATTMAPSVLPNAVGARMQQMGTPNSMKPSWSLLEKGRLCLHPPSHTTDIHKSAREIACQILPSFGN